jgi:hypothetical protein
MRTGPTTEAPVPTLNAGVQRPLVSSPTQSAGFDP